MKPQLRSTDLVSLTALFQTGQQRVQVAGSRTHSSGSWSLQQGHAPQVVFHLLLDIVGSRGPVPNSLCLPQSTPAPRASPVVLGDKRAGTETARLTKPAPPSLLPKPLYSTSSRWFPPVSEYCEGHQGQSPTSRRPEGMFQAWGVIGQGSPLH